MPDIAKAMLFGLGTFLLSAWLVRGAVDNISLNFALRYPNLDRRAIYDQVKDRTYSKGWLISSAIGSLLIGVAAYNSENDAVFLSAMPLGIAVIVGFMTWKSIKDFRRAIKEIGVPWPPHPRDKKWP